MKLRSAEEDISDLQTEFELERQGYLDTIRNQVCNKKPFVTEYLEMEAILPNHKLC